MLQLYFTVYRFRTCCVYSSGPFANLNLFIILTIHRFYCDYCDTYLTHDSVSCVCVHQITLLKSMKEEPVVVFCSCWTSTNLFCFCSSRRWGRPTAVAENTKKMWKITTRNGWRSRLRAWSTKQVSKLLCWLSGERGRVNLDVQSSCTCCLIL